MPVPATFSIIGFDPETNELGVTVESRFLSVGAVVPWVEGGVGAIATQSWANTTYGPRGLDLLKRGVATDEVIRAITKDDENAAERQVGIVDAHGRSATYTGAQCKDWAGGAAGPNYAAQGNILTGQAVVDSMVKAFTQTPGYLADRLVAALRAGQAAGGDRRGQQSAALYIAKPNGGYGGFNDRYADLRVDDHPAPIEELARLLELHKLYNFPAEPEDVLPVDAVLGVEIVRELRRAGVYKGSSEAFDGPAREALVAFMHVENLENRVRDDGAIDRQTLDYLRAFKR